MTGWQEAAGLPAPPGCPQESRRRATCPDSAGLCLSFIWALQTGRFPLAIWSCPDVREFSVLRLVISRPPHLFLPL